MEYVQSALSTLRIEIEALQAMTPYFNADFERACHLIQHTKGKVVVMGMGKSGHIGRKIAATLASTGTPAFFIHPAEAAHGDLGMIDLDDIVLAISNSGESNEILTLYPVLKRRHITVISMTGKPNSSMARESDVHLQITVPQEACPHGLAPTSSTTATLVMGDAIAVALLQAKGFTSNDFALSHPGGSLGRKLLLKLSDIMHSGDQIPTSQAHDSIQTALLEMTAKGHGMTIVTDSQQNILGLFTDGDLRRLLDHEVSLKKTPISEVMTRNPYTFPADALAVEGLNFMESKRINGLVLVQNGRLVGVINMHDLLKSGVV